MRIVCGWRFCERGEHARQLAVHAAEDLVAGAQDRDLGEQALDQSLSIAMAMKLHRSEITRSARRGQVAHSSGDLRVVLTARFSFFGASRDASFVVAGPDVISTSTSSITGTPNALRLVVTSGVSIADEDTLT